MDAPSTDLEELPDDVPTLQGMVRQLRAQVAELQAQMAQLQSRLDALTRTTFGRRSERSKRSKPSAAAGEKPRGKRHEHGRARLPDSLERRLVVHDLTDEQKPCGHCGCERICIGEQTAEQLDYDPAVYFVRRTVKKTYACRQCDPDSVPAELRVHTAGPVTVGPIPKGLCGPGLLSYVVSSKFADHLPLHRLAGIIARSGVSISESTLGGWVRQAAELATPLYQLMHRRILQSAMLWSDDTRSRYLVPGQDQTSRGYFWVAIGDFSAPYTVFDFTEGYSAEQGPGRFLAGFKGFLHADCLKQYEPLFHERGAKHVACWAHARRKFLDAGDAGQPAMDLIRRLYRIEANLPEPDSPEVIEQRGRIRQRDAKAVLAELKAWLDAEQRRALPKSPLGEAIGYVLGHWDAFVRYTERGDLTIDNNLSERTLRQIAVGRNNWTFLGAASAGRSAAIHYTLVGTCRHLGLDPFAYLREVFPALHALGDDPELELLAEWLPDRWAARVQQSHFSNRSSAA